MKTCMRCKKDSVVAISVDDSIESCGHTFTAQLPADKCNSCGEIVIQGDDIRKFERRVAVEIAKAGLRSKDSFKLLRKSLGIEGAALAELLDVPADFIGYWENGDWPVDPRALGVLRSLVLGKHDDTHSSLDSLGVLRKPRSLGRKVRVVIGDALAAASKALQFGSAAHTAPALA